MNNDSSIPVKNMHQLEWLAYYIDPPRWPTAIFGAIKPDLAAAGERIFRSRCAGCHAFCMTAPDVDSNCHLGCLTLVGLRASA